MARPVVNMRRKLERVTNESIFREPPLKDSERNAAKGKYMLLHRCASFVAKIMSELLSDTIFPAEER
ncbi:hypothetical protein QMA09_05900, partial [Planococcus sp. APC 3906]|nr:hypothetical protein [Planococcus sp. APC 3906]